MNVQIGRDQFETDHARKGLVNADGTVLIPYAVMEQKGSNMRFLYDKKAGTFFNGDWSKHPTDWDIAMIRIPNTDRIDKMERGLIPQEKAWEIPKADVGRDRFFVDAIERELVGVTDTDKRIPFQAMTDKIIYLELAYDVMRGIAFQGTPEELDRNPHVERIKIPSIITLDPELMLEVMKLPAFEARVELERRMQAFDHQWMKHQHHDDGSQITKKTKPKFRK